MWGRGRLPAWYRELQTAILYLLYGVVPLVCLFVVGFFFNDRVHFMLMMIGVGIAFGSVIVAFVHIAKANKLRLREAVTAGRPESNVQQGAAVEGRSQQRHRINLQHSALGIAIALAALAAWLLNYEAHLR